MSGANSWKGTGKILVNSLMLVIIFVVAINSAIMATGPMGDPEPAPPVGTPWGEEDPPTDPENGGSEESPSSVLCHPRSVS
jgi:hypothetical protein